MYSGQTVKSQHEMGNGEVVKIGDQIWCGYPAKPAVILYLGIDIARVRYLESGRERTVKYVTFAGKYDGD